MSDVQVSAKRCDVCSNVVLSTDAKQCCDCGKDICPDCQKPTEVRIITEDTVVFSHVEYQCPSCASAQNVSKASFDTVLATHLRASG